MTKLIDSRCSMALEKIGLAKGAESLAKMSAEIGAAEGHTTLGFLKADDEADANWIAELTLTVKKV